MSHPHNFTLPDLIAICPWAPGTNPYHEEASEKSSAWIDAFGFFQGAKRQHFLQSATELFASYTYPYAEFEEFRALCDCMNLLWIVDEMLDDQNLQEVRGTADTLVRAMKGELHDESSIVRMTTEWKGRLQDKVGPNSWRRFVSRYSEYLASIVHEKELEEQQTFDNLKEYETHRRSNVFMAGCFCLAEYALKIDLPDAVFEDERFMKVHWAAVDMIGYSNDVYSYAREREIGLDRNNIITVIMHEKKLTLQQAANYVGKLFQSLVDMFQMNKAQLPSFTTITRDDSVDKDVEKYVHALELAVVGNLFWSFETKRYFGEDREQVKRSLVVTLKA